MYKTILLTQKEIEILDALISSFIASGGKDEARNLTIILSHLKGKKPIKNGS
jgi:hypothetical protein